MRCTQNCNAYCQYRSTERAQFFSMTMLNHITQPMLQQLSKLKFWLNFASSNTFTWPLATQLPTTSSILISFCSENTSTTSKRHTFQEFVKSWSMDFYATGINKLISLWQKWVDCNVPVLINKDVFKSNYNDLKYTVWSHNYIWTNLIFARYLFVEIMTSCQTNKQNQPANKMNSQPQTGRHLESCSYHRCECFACSDYRWIEWL